MALEKALDFLIPGEINKVVFHFRVCCENIGSGKCWHPGGELEMAARASGDSNTKGARLFYSAAYNAASCFLPTGLNKPLPTQEEKTLPKGWQLDAISQRR